MHSQALEPSSPTASSSVSHKEQDRQPKPRDKQSLEYAFRTGLAGGIAGCVAKTAVAPLDRVKILLQASKPEYQQFAGSWTGFLKAARSIYVDAGVRGLLQGHSATLLRIFPYAGIKFMAYDQLHHILMPTKDQETPTRRFIAGSASGALSVFFTYPLEVLRVRLAYHTYQNTTSSPRLRPSIQRAIRTIYREGNGVIPSTSASPGQLRFAPSTSKIFYHLPILKFYRGFSVTLIGIIPYAGTSFLVYGSLRALAVKPPFRKYTVIGGDQAANSKIRTNPITDLTIGAVSGMISQTVSYPFEVLRRRMQIGGLVRPDAWLGWRETVAAVWKQNGWKGFYVGLTIGYVKVVPMTAISFLVWERMKTLLGV